MPELRQAVEKLNSDVRNYLTPIIAYSDMLTADLAGPELRKVMVIQQCAQKLLTSLEEFLDVLRGSNTGPQDPERQ